MGREGKKVSNMCHTSLSGNVPQTNSVSLVWLVHFLFLFFILPSSLLSALPLCLEGSGSHADCSSHCAT